MSRSFDQRLYDDYLHGGEQDPRAAIESRRPYLKRLIQRHFPKHRDARILDLGCGHGSLLAVAKQQGYCQLAGIDISPAQVKQAQALGLNEVTLGDAQQHLETRQANSLDLVVSFDQLEHLNKAELLAITDAVWRVLKPGGRWLIHVPNAASPFFGQVRYGDLTHQTAFTADSLRRWLLASQFERIDCFQDDPVPHGIKSAIRAALWWGLARLIRLAVIIETGAPPVDGIVSQNLLAIAYKH